jgi:tRNA(Ile)-lysidine synthase
MDLLEKFKDYIAKEHLWTTGDRLLLAVSGGLDSVVLAELCHRCGFDVLIVHCNFQLRGQESERDEAFVRQFSTRFGEVRVERFDTLQYAAENKVSVQVAARELRYHWFESIVRQGGARWIVTAHHLDDNIETMLMHFFKGTGIAGMRGMLPKQGNIVRPLLFARKEVLRSFAVDAGLPWVEDSSNESDKYTRNFFRHQLIPLAGQAFPSAMENLSANLVRFREAEALYRQAVEGWKKKLVEQRGTEAHIPVEKLRKAAPLPTIVYEIMEPFGFSPQQTGEIVALLDSPTGRYVRGRTHRVLKNRNWLIVSPLVEAEPGAAPILIEEGWMAPSPGSKEARVSVPFAEGELRLTLVQAGQLLDQGSNVALLDADRIGYPLLLRRWKPGDYFYPLGMRKKKKVARFLIDTRVSMAEKERVWVLEMDKKILWLVGHRIDDRWKIGPGTTRLLRIEWVRSSGGPAS